MYLLQVPGQSEHEYFFFKDVTFSKVGTAESVISGSPKTLSGLTTTGWGWVGQPWSLQAQHLRGRLYIPDFQWRVCGSKLLFLEWSCLGDHRQNLSLKFH